MSNTSLVPIEKIEKAIYLIRGEKVILDRDLAELYGVGTHVLKQAVRRNKDRFPGDFMFVLNPTEFRDWRSQFVISKADRTGLRHPPMAFTEQGVAMLSSVLRSKRAVSVNIEIMRAFVRLRRAALASEKLMPLIEDLSRRVDIQDSVIADIVESIRRIVDAPPGKRSRPIGFTADIEAKTK